MKKVLLLLVLAIILSVPSFADYTEMKLDKIYYDIVGRQFTSIIVKDVDRNIKLTFEYTDDIKYYIQYSKSTYFYDYERDLLLIMHGDNVIYQEFEYGRKK